MDSVSVETVNFDTLAAAFDQAPQLSYKFVDQEAHRTGKRIRKKFIKDRLRGEPGIQWGATKQKIGDLDQSVGGNVRAFGIGDELQDYRFVAKISSFLGVHEKGATITGNMAIRLKSGISPQPGSIPGLFLLGHSSVLAVREPHLRALYLLRRQVTIPARLGFEPMMQAEIKADLIPRLEAAMVRGVQVSIEQNVKTLTDLVHKTNRYLGHS